MEDSFKIYYKYSYDSRMVSVDFFDREKIIRKN